MTVEEKVVNILSELSGEKTIYSDDNLQEDLGLDSLSLVTLLVLIEDGFDIILDESDMNPFELINVRQVVDLVERYLK